MKKLAILLFVCVFSFANNIKVAVFTKTLNNCNVVRGHKLLQCKNGMELYSNDEMINISPDVLNHIRIFNSNYVLVFENGKLKFEKNNYVAYFKKYGFQNEKAAVRGESKKTYKKILSDQYFNPKSSLVFIDQNINFTLSDIFENPNVTIFSKNNKEVFSSKMSKTDNGYKTTINVRKFAQPGMIYFWVIKDKDGEVEKGNIFVVQDSKSAKYFITKMIKRIKHPDKIKIYSEIGYFWYAKELSEKGDK